MYRTFRCLNLRNYNVMKNRFRLHYTVHNCLQVRNRSYLIKPKFYLVIGGGGILLRDDLDNFDIRLIEACTNGEKSVVTLINTLKETFLHIVMEYERCLEKQIEIVEECSKMGKTWNDWDILTEHRTLALELDHDLTHVITTLRTIGSLVQESSSLRDIVPYLQVIDKLYKEIDEVVVKEVEHIDQLKTALLNANRENILKLS